MGSKLSRLISHGDGGKGVSDSTNNTGGISGASAGVEHVNINDDCDGAIEDDDFNDFNRDDEDNNDDSGKADKEAGDSNILDAIEDIQKMSRDEITAEFERVSRQTAEAGSPMNNPCYDAANKLMECVRHHPEQLMQCFSVMDAYRSCISRSYREQIEFFLDKDFDVIFPPVEPEPPKKQPEKETGEPEQPKKKLKKPHHPPPMLESNVTKKPTEVTKDANKEKEKAKVDNDKDVPWYQWPPWR